MATDESFIRLHMLELCRAGFPSLPSDTSAIANNNAAARHLQFQTISLTLRAPDAFAHVRLTRKHEALRVNCASICVASGILLSLSRVFSNA